MEYVLIFIGFILGLIIGAFTIIQIGIILFFSIPTTIKLNKANLLKKGNPANKHNLISLTLLSIIYIISLSIIIIWFPGILVSFLVGNVLVFLFGIGQLGANPNNLSDYLNSIEKYFEEDVERERIIAKIAQS